MHSRTVVHISFSTRTGVHDTTPLISQQRLRPTPAFRYNINNYACGVTTSKQACHLRLSLRRLPLHECFREHWLPCWLLKSRQLHSRNTSRASFLAFSILEMKMNATIPGHYPTASRSCHPFLDHKPFDVDPIGNDGSALLSSSGSV